MKLYNPIVIFTHHYFKKIITMKFFKYLIIGLLALIVLLLVIALFVPKQFKSEREIVINKPKQEVFDYIKYVKNQDNFGVWQLSDTAIKTTSTGEDGTVGFKYSWESKKLGNGSQTITGIKEGERLETELYFGFGEPAKSYITTTAINENATKVMWGISGHSPYPFNLMTLFMDLGKDFEKGLSNLKEVLEK